MADDINNNEGMDEAGDAGMPDDLKRLLARAEQGEDGDPDAYNPDADDDEEEDDGNYHVKGPRPISAAGAKYKTGRKALAEAKKAEEEARAARKKAQGKSKKK